MCDTRSDHSALHKQVVAVGGILIYLNLPMRTPMHKRLGHWESRGVRKERRQRRENVHAESAYTQRGTAPTRNGGTHQRHRLALFSNAAVDRPTLFHHVLRRHSWAPFPHQATVYRLTVSPSAVCSGQQGEVLGNELFQCTRSEGEDLLRVCTDFMR
jgi:hypothetical protein